MNQVTYKPLSSGEKRTWGVPQQQFLLKQHKEMFIEDIAAACGKTVLATKNKAFRMGCSIKTKGKANE